MESEETETDSDTLLIWGNLKTRREIGIGRLVVRVRANLDRIRACLDWGFFDFFLDHLDAIS